MNVFFSWSGDRSREIAKAFNQWLPNVLTTVNIFFSPDMEKGARPLELMSNELSESNFGVVFLTPDNLNSTWIHFEAGALAKLKDNNRLWTFLYDLKNTDVVAPLSQFQHTLNTKDEVYKLILSINKNSETQLDTNRVSVIFEKWWPDLETALAEVPAAAVNGLQIANAGRTDRDILEETLELTRLLQRELSLNLHLSEISRYREIDSIPFIEKGEIRVNGDQREYNAPIVRDRICALLKDAPYEVEIRPFDDEHLNVCFSFKPAYFRKDFDAFARTLQAEGYPIPGWMTSGPPIPREKFVRQVKLH